MIVAACVLAVWVSPVRVCWDACRYSYLYNVPQIECVVACLDLNEITQPKPKDPEDEDEPDEQE